jgi:hypothetical protein
MKTKTHPKGRRLSLRRLAAYAGLGLGAAIFACAMLILIFSGAILNGYGKRKIERMFAAGHPGYALRIGGLGYSVGANLLVAQSVTLSASKSSLKIGRISLAGVRWLRFFWGSPTLADVLAGATIEALKLDWEFPRWHYGIRCARLRASLPGSALVADGAELRPLVGDEELFAQSAFRTTRFHVLVPTCIVSGLAYGELLRGRSYRALSIDLDRPFFDVLVNRDKPLPPLASPPRMVHEALAAIRPPLQVDAFRITNGDLRYSERVVVEAGPGVLTFSALNMSADGITNRGEGSAAIQLQAQCAFMNAAALKVQMTIPVFPRDFSLHYSGSLGAMDLTRLDAFVEPVDSTRIKSGSAKGATFEISVTAGQARGSVRAIYQDLKIAFLNKQTGSSGGLFMHLGSFFANTFKIRAANARNAAGVEKEGKVNYSRLSKDEFIEFVWFALRSGVLDLLRHGGAMVETR